jgi:monoterpene epsilon-lactone hydrolase
VSIQLYLFDKFLRFRMKRVFKKDPDVIHLRPMMIAMAKLPQWVPKGVRIDETTIGGVKVERLTPENADHGAAIVYIHGGGFVAGMPKTSRPITGRLAKRLGVPVYVPDYRLAPEHPFPAGLDDVVAVVRGIYERGVAPSRLAIGGDSAGGNLTFASALKLKALGAPMPAALVALSPSTDIPGSFASRKSNAESDAAFDARIFETIIGHYCPNQDPGSPLISPFRGDLRGLPPTLIQCTEVEMLRDDGVEIAERLKEAIVSTKLEIYPKAPHVFQLAADIVPEARRAIDAIVEFLRPRLAAD